MNTATTRIFRRGASVLALLALLAAGTALAGPANGTTGTGAVRTMAVTVDDLVGVSVAGGRPEDFRAAAEKLVGKLREAGVPAVGFVNMAKVYVEDKESPEMAALLDLWLDAGMELGNHTFAHADLHLTTPEAFEAEIVVGEAGLRERVAAHGGQLRYFRHPCLHTGRSLEVRQRVNQFLAERGYTVAAVTVDNGEWICAAAYRCCLNQGDWAAARRLEDEYIDYMLRKVAYFEGQSRQLFDREIPQVLLCHANSLNAACLDRLLAALRGRGYRFVPLGEALADPAYASPDTFTGRGGISWLHRWAFARGVGKDFFDGEPLVPEWMCRIAGIESE